MMIQCIVLDQKDIADRLLVAITKITQEHWPDAQLFLKSCADYWKIEGNKKIIYGLINSPTISISTYIKIFKLTWAYTEGMAYDINLHIKYQDESAVWSQLCNPKETFLLPGVEWVHIYTWPEGLQVANLLSK